MVVSTLPASVMALIDNVVHFEIFLERETMQAIRTGRVTGMTPRMSTATGAMDLIQGYFHAEKCQ